VVYPNPFRISFNLDFYSHEEGVSNIELFDASSTRVHQKNLETIIGRNTVQLSSLSFLPSGMYFLRFKFPNGEVKQERVIHIQD
jgi:hypothetical protein